jgi:GNAT superfamily N-acetyltransferase
VNDVEVRPARAGEARVIAELRWRWFDETAGTPATSRDEFVDFFARWLVEHEMSHYCVVAVRGGEIVGMAWLAVVPRVPSPRAPKRASGDVQCVYVVPAERNSGTGALLVAAVLDRARSLELDHVTVHSSSRAVSVYKRAGFMVSEKLLQTADLG